MRTSSAFGSDRLAVLDALFISSRLSRKFSKCKYEMLLKMLMGLPSLHLFQSLTNGSRNRGGFPASDVHAHPDELRARRFFPGRNLDHAEA